MYVFVQHKIHWCAGCPLPYSVFAGMMVAKLNLNLGSAFPTVSPPWLESGRTSGNSPEGKFPAQLLSGGG